MQKEKTFYQQGQDLADTIIEMKELDIPFDPRFDIADVARSTSRANFDEFMKGLNERMRESE